MIKMRVLWNFDRRMIRAAVSVIHIIRDADYHECRWFIMIMIDAKNF